MKTRRKKKALAPLLAVVLLGAAAPAAQGALNWDVTSYDFGSQESDVSSAPRTFTLTATCDADGGSGMCAPSPSYTYGAVTAPGADFGIDSTNCTGTLQPVNFPGMATCTARVTFKPSSNGAKTGVLDTVSGPDVFLGGTGVSADDSNKAGGKKCKKKRKKNSSASAAKKKKKCKKKKKG